MKLTHLLCGTMLGLTTILTGCTSIQSQSTHIPQNIQQQLNTKQPIISYFSKTPNEQDCGCASTVDQTYSLKPIEDGYYRTLLGRDKEGRFLVQGETVKQKLWYSTGAKAADFSVSDDASIQVTDNKVWNKEGQLVEDEAQQSEIVESIYNELNADRE